MKLTDGASVGFSDGDSDGPSVGATDGELDG